MPNYSHGTKLTLASAEEPPYLTVGTDVSAKYKGAFCEAKIIDVNKHVKLRVLFEGISGSYLIDDTDVKPGSVIETGNKIEAKHPSKKKQQIFAQATISKILDHSRYTVIFDDGDQCILRRNSICLKSGKHFAESETLDQLPLTNPEHFGNPVKVGAYEQQQSQLLQRDQQHSVTKSNNDTNTNPSLAPTSSIGNSDSGSRSQKTMKQESTGAATSDKSKGGEVAPSPANGRKGAKGRKRRESVTNKHTADLDDGSMDSSQDSADIEPVNSNVKFDLIAIGVKLMIQYGKGKIQNVYEAKVNKIETNPNGRIRYFVHYTGWNNRYDEWVTRNRIVSIVTEKETGRDGRSRQPEPIPIETFAATTSSSSSSSNSTAKEKEKEKERELERRREKEKEKEREKELELARQKEKELEKERERQKELERQKERERERELELEKEKKLKEEERKKELEREQERIKKEQKEKEEARKRELEKELEKQKEKEKERLREKEREKERDREKAKEKDFLTKTRRSRKSEIVSAINTTPAAAAASLSSAQPLESQQAPQPTNKPGRSGSVGRQQRQRVANSTTVITSVTATTATATSTETVASKSTSSSLTTSPPTTITTSTSSSDTTSNQDEKTRSSRQTEMDVDLEPEKSVEQAKVDDKKRSDVRNLIPPKPFKSYMKSMNFCSEINEQDCDKKISILQERIIELRQFYLMLKSGLADLDRRRKRPRTESS